ncbi:serine/threonine-protein kinase [Hyalangium rubrum]|uniref:non-specific serine/threonine protein kinase n=1 Tax=Hyalangium rubrum TaxID=3103134 RepID=A0ABU5HA68_9BACT|nr:serine/threonine-protein kinase [Hyalangium sp. s54d21]MDY7229754.1 serine/threonine-protein kinase [Hyalangium sp. s54d21]
MIAFLGSQGLPTGTMIDSWKVVASLGSGGFGAVQKVEKNGRLYALKIALLPEGSPDEKKTHARTLRELLCLLLMDHPNIVRVVAHGRWPDETGGHLYLVLEYVEGWTLAHWIERIHPTALEIIRVFVKTAAAISYMHSRGVFHRDLKLTNVLIRKSNGEPVIIDFGAADFAQAPELTDAGLPPGTERYRAPEANRWWYANKKKPKARYDFRVTDELFAFGVMLHDALTDPRPTEDRQRSAINSILVAPRDPQARNPRIPDALASLVRRLLAKDPAKRSENFEAVRRELAELLEHQGAEYRVSIHSPSAQVSESERAEGSPRPLPSVDSSAKLRWRWRKWLVVGGAVGAAALAAVAASTLGWDRPEEFAAAAPPAHSPSSTNPESPPPASVPAKAPATETAPGATVTVSIQKESNVKMQKGALTPQKPPKFANEAERLKWCKAIGLGTVLAVNAGCPGAQVKPERGDCPADAVKAMEEHGLRWRDQVVFTLGSDIKKGMLSPPLKSGRVEATVVQRGSGSMGTPNLPLGTRLFGELWILKEDPASARLRFYRAQLPNGPEFPVCIVSGSHGHLAIMEREPNGAIRTGPAPTGTVILDSWP